MILIQKMRVQVIRMTSFATPAKTLGQGYTLSLQIKDCLKDSHYQYSFASESELQRIQE